MVVGEGVGIEADGDMVLLSPFLTFILKCHLNSLRACLRFKLFYLIVNVFIEMYLFNIVHCPDPICIGRVVYK